MSEEERDQIGRFFLKPDRRTGILYIHWYDRRTRQTPGVTTGTRDREAARDALAVHVITHSKIPAGATDAQLAAVLQSYYLGYARHLPSAHAVRSAVRIALEVWGDPDVGHLERSKQLELVAEMREAEYSDWTIDGHLNRIWAAMNWYRRDNKTLVVPAQITAEDWNPVLQNRERTYTLEELAALLNAAASSPEGSRYSREHWWRFLVLAIGTASREAALRELTWPQIHLEIGRLKLNPEGRRQTKKRRPTVPIAPTLAAELASWERSESGYVITYYDKPLATREFFDLLAETAGVTGGPNIIRHTVRTWLADMGVPDADADMFMGHKDEGSATGARYKHRRPEYLLTVSEAIEELYAALADMVKRPFKGRELVDQPAPVHVQCMDIVSTALVRFSQNAENNEVLERETRLELATPTLARSCSTN